MRTDTPFHHLSTLGFHKLVQVVGVLIFALLIPRTLGPERFGQFSFIYSLSLLLQIGGDLGGLDIMGRFVPGWREEGEEGRGQIEWLTWQFFLLRLAIGALLTGSLIVVLPRLVSWLTGAQAALIGLAVTLRLLAWTSYHLAFGLNWTGRWVFELSWRQIILAPLLLAFASLALDGILIALLLSELVFALIGFYWSRHYLRPQALSWARLRPYLRFGSGFFLANILIIWLYQGGPVLLEFLTHDTVAVGFLALALNVFMLFTVVFTQTLASFVPTLSLFHSRQQYARIQHWLDHLTRYSAILMGLGVIGVAFLAYPLAPIIFGAAYQAVAALLLTFCLALLVQPLVWIGRYAATALGQPWVALSGAMAGGACATLLALLLIPSWLAAGAALALVGGLAAFAGVLTWRGRAWFQPPWKSLAQIYLPLLLLIPVISSPRTLLPSILLALVFTAFYLALLWRLKVASPRDLMQTLRSAKLGSQ